MSRERPPLPITLVTGWSAPSTIEVVDRMVRARPGRSAVVHHGSGPTARDQAWSVEAVEEELVFCSIDRCRCCAVRLDLIVAVSDLARRNRRPDQVVLHLSGGADIAAALQTFLRDPYLRATTEVVSVATVVDAPAIVPLIDRHGDLAVRREVLEQVASADQLVIAGGEAVTARALDALPWTLVPPPAPPGAPTLVHLTVDGHLDREAVSGWMDDLHHQRGGDLLRLQGVLAVEDEPARWIARGVRTTLDFDDGEPWGPDEHRQSRMWLVGVDLDADGLRTSLESCTTNAR